MCSKYKRFSLRTRTRETGETGKGKRRTVNRVKVENINRIKRKKISESVKKSKVERVLYKG